MANKTKQERLKQLKEKYKEEYPKFVEKYGAKADEYFYNFFYHRYMMEQARRRAMAHSKKERNREARAMIIFFKAMLKYYLDVVKRIYPEIRKEFIQKEGQEEFDYSIYIDRLIEEYDQKRLASTQSDEVKKPVSTQEGKQVFTQKSQLSSVRHGQTSFSSSSTQEKSYSFYSTTKDKP